MKRLIASLLLLFCCTGFAQIPEPTQRLVNDYAQLFTASQTRTLETRLRHYYDTTSNAIVVVTISDLNGYAAADYAQRLGDKWGVGTGKWNNGLVVLLCPAAREIFIATGYGLEGVLPDVICRRIAENEMKPHFQEGDYYAGIVAGLDVILPVAAKEFSYEQFQQEQEAQKKRENWAVIIIFCFVSAAIVAFSLIRNYFQKHPTQKQLARRQLMAATTQEDLAQAVQQAQQARMSRMRIDKIVKQLIQSKINAIVAAETYRAMVDAMSVARALGADTDAVLAARARVPQQALSRISHPNSRLAVENAIALAEALDVPKAEIEAAKVRGRKRATEKVAQASNRTELANAAELALWLGATAAAIALAKRRANTRWTRQSHIGGSPTIGRSGGGRSGNFGGFGGGRFGGGGGGAKW